MSLCGSSLEGELFLVDTRNSMCSDGTHWWLYNQAVWWETAVEQYRALNSNGIQMWGELRVMGSCSSVVRALVAQASDPSSIPSDFSIFFSTFCFSVWAYSVTSFYLFTRLHRTISLTLVTVLQIWWSWFSFLLLWCLLYSHCMMLEWVCLLISYS